MSDTPPPDDGPWIKYQKPAGGDGPWTKYQARHTGNELSGSPLSLLSYLPVKRDETGLHWGVPGIVGTAEKAGAGMVSGMESMGGKLLGDEPNSVGEDLSPNEISTLAALSPASVAAGTGRAIAGAALARNPESATRLEDFEAQGVTPSVPAIGQGRAAGLAAQAGRVLPFSPVGRGIARNIAETQAATERAAGQYGTATDEFAGGNIARNAMRRFASDRSQAANDFGEFYRHMQGAPDTAIPNTLRVLSDLKGRFPNAPGLTGLFTASPVLRMAEELQPRMVNIPAKTSSMLDEFGNPVVTVPAHTVQQGGKLSISELREMRSKIGEQLEAPTIGPDSIPRGQLKQLYGALTKDMQAAATQRGPAAVRALAKATGNYKIRMGIIDRLDAITNKDAAESVYQALDRASTEGGGQDAGLLKAVKRISTPAEWNDIASAVIRRLGNPKPGVPRAPGEPDFSINSLATNWRKLTSRAKDTLFGPDEPSSPRAALEQLSRVAAAVQNVSKLGNTSHTFEVGAAASVIGELFGSLAAGRIPIPELGAYTGAYGVSKLLMSPAFTRWFYKLPTIVHDAPPMMAHSAAVATLRAAMAQEAGNERVPEPENAKEPGNNDQVDRREAEIMMDAAQTLMAAAMHAGREVERRALEVQRANPAAAAPAATGTALAGVLK